LTEFGILLTIHNKIPFQKLQGTGYIEDLVVDSKDFEFVSITPFHLAHVRVH